MILFLNNSSPRALSCSARKHVRAEGGAFSCVRVRLARVRMYVHGTHTIPLGGVVAVFYVCT